MKVVSLSLWGRLVSDWTGSVSKCSDSGTGGVASKDGSIQTSLEGMENVSWGAW